MTAVAPPNTNLPHQQSSSASCAGDIPTESEVSQPKTVRFYCADVPDLSEFFYSKKLSDLNFVIGERKITAHRSRLASVSPFLASVFAADNSEVSTVIMPEVSYSAVNILINFLYSGFMRVTKKEVENVLEVASLLGIKYPIDIEETELGVVRIKPSGTKKRTVTHEVMPDFGLSKRPRRDMPRVAIYEGAKIDMTNFMDKLSTPMPSPRHSEAEVVNLMDMDDIAILPSSVISLPNFDQVPDAPDNNVIILDSNSTSRTVSPGLPVPTPPLSSSPRPRSRIKKTKTRNDLLNEAQQNQLEQVTISLVSRPTLATPVAESADTSANDDHEMEVDQPEENIDVLDLQMQMIHSGGTTEVVNNPASLVDLAQRATDSIEKPAEVEEDEASAEGLVAEGNFVLTDDDPEEATTSKPDEKDPADGQETQEVDREEPGTSDLPEESNAQEQLEGAGQKLVPDEEAESIHNNEEEAKAEEEVKEGPEESGENQETEEKEASDVDASEVESLRFEVEESNDTITSDTPEKVVSENVPVPEEEEDLPKESTTDDPLVDPLSDVSVRDENAAEDEKSPEVTDDTDSFKSVENN